MEASLQATKSKWNWAGFIVLLAVMFTIWSISGVAIYCFVPKTDRGIFGDMFGAVNALFSAFAFAGVIYSIYLQSMELRDQREELKLTRQEFQTQNETFSKQRFENTFFKMLELIQVGLNEVNYDDAPQFTTGSLREVNEAMGLSLEAFRRKNGIEKLVNGFSSKTNNTQFHDYSISNLGQIIEKEINRYNAKSYVTIIANAFHLLSNSTLIQESERQFYGSILNSLLTNADRHLLYLSTMSQEHQSLKPILNKYGAKPDYNVNQFMIGKEVIRALEINN